MIVRRSGSDWLLVAQADHARLAGEMVGLARSPELVDHPRRRTLLRAVAEHDNGWWEEDSAPRLDPGSGGPLDFRDCEAALRREIWERCAGRHAASDPYLAALVAGHCLRLTPTVDDPAWLEFRRALDERRRGWLEAAGVGADAAAEDDRWLRLGDELSLVAAARDPALLGATGWRAETASTESGVELRVAPFPWAGAIRFELPARRIPAIRYPDAVALGSAWIAAPRERLAVRLTAMGGPTEPAQPTLSSANHSR